MKILVSSIACNPVHGSEASVGWNTVLAIAKRHEVWVLTSVRNREPFEKWLETHELPGNIHLRFLGEIKPWHSNRMIARLQSWSEYRHWGKELLEAARALQKEVRFDLVHHVTYATWRVASPLWRLGLPFIWGPVGGGESLPWAFASTLSPASLVFEAARDLSNRLSRRTSSVSQCARRATLCVGGNEETYRLLSEIRGTREGVEQLCGNFFVQEEIDRFGSLLPGKRAGGKLRLFAGGNLQGYKGMAIALHALAKVRDAGVDFDYLVGGSGPEREHLKALAGKLGLGGRVIFSEGFSGDEYRRQLIASHVYLLPTLREYAGRTMMEAMLAGCVPVVAKRGGPGEIVTGECGFCIPALSVAQMADEIARAILFLDKDRAGLERMGREAHRRIATVYSSAYYNEAIERIYAKVLASSVCESMIH